MTRKTRIRTLLLALCLTEICAEAKPWRGLVPLHSTRADVERLLGKPVLYGGVATYYLTDATVSVFYSKYACGDKMNFDQWNVPPDTVLSISVRPKSKVVLKDLQLDLRKFEKGQAMSDVLDQFIYVDKVQGFSLVVYEERGVPLVAKFIYWPAESDAYLHCPGRPMKDVGRCPPATAISIDGPTGSVASGTQIKLAAYVFGLLAYPPTDYIWSTSAGRITSGNGTMEIVLDTAGLKSQTVTVNVEVKGLPPACANAASFKVQVVGKQ